VSARCAPTLNRSVKSQRRFQQVNQRLSKESLEEADCSSQRASEEFHRRGEEKMATEGHRQGPRGDHKRMRREEMDKELKETREELNRLMLKWKKMQQGEKGRWRYEWPMKKKVKWPIQQLISRRKKKILRRWLRQVENLRNTEEKMVYICEPEDGESLDGEERSTEDLIDF
jgi:hypothetical protein